MKWKKIDIHLQYIEVEIKIAYWQIDDDSVFDFVGRDDTDWRFRRMFGTIESCEDWIEFILEISDQTHNAQWGYKVYFRAL